MRVLTPVCFKCGLKQKCEIPEEAHIWETEKNLLSRFPRWYGKIKKAGSPVRFWICNRCHDGQKPYHKAPGLTFLTKEQVVEHYMKILRLWELHSPIAKDPVLMVLQTMLRR